MSTPLKLLALADLLRRYTTVWRHAWQHRHQMTGPSRQAHEVEFLPAALALQDSPAPAAPRVAMWMLLTAAMSALAWSIWGQVDVVATAQGKVVPGDRIKTIQPFEVSSVRRILVADGQSVRAGEVLVELDATTVQADLGRVQGELDVARLLAARGQALLSSVATGRLSALQRPDAVSQVQWLEAERLLQGEYSAYQAKRSRIEADTARREAEWRSIQALVHKLEQTVPIARQRARDFENLVSQNFVSRHGYLEREQVRIEQEADLANLKSKLDEIQAALREGTGQLAELEAETRRAALERIQEGQKQASALAQELRKAESRGRLMTLTSPVDGTVQQLAVHTVGGVVTPAQPLMVVVPHDHRLEVEAFLENKDIGFVKTGQTAQVKVETFQFTKYGTLAGQVATVSHDAIQDEKRGLLYAARVVLDKTTMPIDGTDVNLSPGMAVTVEVKIGQRRVVEYFLAPLIQRSSESLRER